MLNGDKYTKDIKDIEMKLEQLRVFNPMDTKSSSYNFEMIRHLRTIFNKSREDVEEIISQQLKQFQNKRKAGLETIYGASSADLKASKENQEIRQSVIEKNLMPKFLKMLEFIEDENDNSKKVLVSALSTVMQNIFNLSYYEPIKQFVRDTGNSMKMEYIMKGHRLVPKICYSENICDYCMNVLWGIAPQGYECDCGIKIHEECIDKLSGMCMLHRDENESDSEFNESKDLSKLMQFVQKAIGNKHIDDYKRIKGDRPKSDPGLYR